MKFVCWKKVIRISAATIAAVLLILIFPAHITFMNSAEKIHRDAVVLDGHNDMLLWLTPPHDLFPWEAEKKSEFLPVLDFNQDLEDITKFGHIDLPSLKEGGLEVPFFAVFAPERYSRTSPLNKALAQIYALDYNIQKNEDKIAHAKTLEGIEEITAADKIAAFLTVEGADYIKEPSGKELLRQIYDLGVRVLAPTWNHSNELAEGLNSIHWDGTPSPGGMGLTSFGKDILQEMNELGIVVDVSHLHENSFWDIMEKTEAPVIASHSSASGVRPHPRNLTDEQIKALAEEDGVIHITFVPDFLSSGNEPPSVKDIVDHIDYVVELVGVEHVGVGSDFDGAPMPDGISDVSDLPLLTEELVQRGYSAKEAKKILGENTLTVLENVEKRASQRGLLENIGIWLGFDTGEEFDGFNPQLFAVVSTGSADLREKTARIVINGEEYPAEYINFRTYPGAGFSAVTLSANFQYNEFYKGFNVITIELTDGEGGTKRSTEIVHAGDV